MEKFEELKLIRACTEDERERLFKEVFPRMPKPPSLIKETIDGNPVIIVNCTDEFVDFTLELGNLIHKAAKLRKLKEYFKSNPEWRQSGFMGQFACKYYFTGDMTAGFVDVPLGKADRGDMNLDNFTINVITRGKLYVGEDYAIIDKKRFERKPYPLYIVCSRVENKIIIWGYARWDEVKNWDIEDFGKGPAYFNTVKALHPVEELKEVMID